MKYVDEFRQPEKAEALFKAIDNLAAPLSDKLARPVHIMEFCGGHTHAIFRFGLEQRLSKSVELIHGPGCPVCVLPMGRVDDCVALAERPEVIFTTFGDAMRVPGSQKSLLQAKADGADIRMVYSPLDALNLAKKNPDREVIFFALGFETTMPVPLSPCCKRRRKIFPIFLCFATISLQCPSSSLCWIRRPST